MTRIICGLDISSRHLDACIGREGARLRVERTPSGIEELAAFCRRHAVDMVVMEATGGYEKEPFALLWGQGIPCAVVNPRQVRHFAEGMGVFEKADHIDSGMIAWYAQVRKLKPQPPASEHQSRLQALAVRLRQVTELRVSQLNQRRLVEDAHVLEGISEIITLLNRQIRALSKEIADLLDRDPLWQALGKSFSALKGVADRTVARVLALMPEIGTLSGKAAAKLVGLAPIIKESGQFKGKRRVRGGREGVRSILVLVADCVAKHEPDFIAFKEKLLTAGKPKLVVRVALARKLLVRLNAKARDIRKARAEATPQSASVKAA